MLVNVVTPQIKGSSPHKICGCNKQFCNPTEADFEKHCAYKKECKLISY